MAFNTRFGGSGFRRQNYGKNLAIGVLAFALVVAIAVALFLNGKITSTQNSLAALSHSYNISQAKLNSLQSNLSYVNSNMDNVLARLQDQNYTILSQNSTIVDLNARISSLQSELSSEQGQSVSQSSSLNNTITDLEAQIAVQNSTVSALQNENSTSQSIINLKNATTEVNSRQFNETPLETVTIADFYAPYAGYLSISGTTNSTYARILVYDTGITPQSAFNFTSGSTLTVPVIPGTITVSLYDQNSTENLASNMTVEYTN